MLFQNVTVTKQFCVHLCVCIRVHGHTGVSLEGHVGVSVCIYIYIKMYIQLYKNRHKHIQHILLVWHICGISIPLLVQQQMYQTDDV